MATPGKTAEQTIDFQAALTFEAAAQPEGRPAKFSMIAYSGGAIRQPWSDVPIVVDLAGMDVPSTVPILRQHSVSVGGIGHTTDAKAAAGKLLVSGEVSRDTEEAREFVASAKRGYPWRASIGARVTAMSDIREGTVTVNGQTFTAPLKVATKSTLYEVSVVELPADAGTSVAVAATATTQGVPPMSTPAKAADGTEAPAVIATAAPTPAVATAAPVVIAAAPVVPVAPVPAVPAHIQASREAEAADLERCAAIHAVAGITPVIAAQAIRDGWSVDRAELHTLRAARPGTGINVIVPAQPEMTGDVMAAAICASGGLDIAKHFPLQACEVAQKAFRGSMGLQQLLVTAARQNGWQGDIFMRSNNAIRDVLAAGFSSGSLASVLSNAANKFLMDAFNSVESAWRLIASIHPNANDFREYNTYAFTGDLVMKPLGQGGNIAHGTLADVNYTNKLGTVARMMTITREDIINDNIGILRGGSQKLGRGAALALNLAFWAEFANNGGFFTAGNINLLVGADTALASAGLAKATLAFRKQIGPDGNPLGVDPKILLVPAELEITAEEILTSTQLNTGGASTETRVPNRNVWAGKYQLAVTSYLSNAAAVGAANVSSTAWYLLADPADLPTVEVAFLRGATAPTIEDVQPEPDVLGVSLRGFYDFGVRKQVPQGGNKSKGTA